MYKDSFDRRYIDLILQNHGQIQPLKSCQLKRRNRIETKINSDIRQSSNSDNRINSNNKIFSVSDQQKITTSKVPAKIDNLIKVKIERQDQQKLIDMIHQKNQQIASALLKQKKSLSDVIYQNGSSKNIKTKRFLDKNGNPIKNLVQMQRESDILYPNKRPNFPKINKIPIERRNSHSSASSLSQGSKQKYRQKIIKDANFKFEQVNSPYIQNFLKLKQQVYDPNKIKQQQQLKIRKKKIQNQKKIKRQKNKVKNSLQQYLQAKIIPKQDTRYKSLGTQIKQQKKLTQLDKVHEFIQLQNQVKRQAKLLSFKKKSNNNVGLRTKISSKHLFHESQVTVYQNKIKFWRQFLFIINLSYKVFDPIIIQDISGNMKTQQKYKYYLGKGNNSGLIRALLKRRFWWTQVQDPKQANFVWTQLKNNNYYQYQKKSDRRYQIYQQDQPLKQKNNTKKQQHTKKGSIFRAPLPDQLEKILTHKDINRYRQFLKQNPLNGNNEIKYQNFSNRLKFFPSISSRDQEIKQYKVHNHLPHNYLIGNKKALFYNLKDYYQLIGQNVFNIIPLTFHLGQQGTNGKVFQQFLKYFKQFRKNKSIKNVWIMKPGQNSNRGRGITVVDELYQINKILNPKNKKSQDKGTFILQKYIQRPLLYKGRKFDIRHFMLATKMYGKMRLYWFGQGYIRTSSYDYDISDITDEMIHLTNDAIQKQAYDYGKFEEGNKISYSELQRYLDFSYPNRKYSITNQMYPQMKQIALKSFKACYLNMDLDHTQHNFQIFGLDFMLDSNFNMYLIEVNTNPCLQMNCNLLNRIIPQMVQHAFRLTIDPIFPPSFHYPNTLKHFVPDTQRLQYQLIFDQGRDGKQIQQLYKNAKRNQELLNVQEDDQTFQNDQKQGQLQIEIQ